MTAEDDARLVADEIARLRVVPTGRPADHDPATLRVTLLEALTTATAAAYLRGEALRALAGGKPREVWTGLAELSLILQRERRAHLRDDRPVGMRGRMSPNVLDVRIERARLVSLARRSAPLDFPAQPSVYHTAGRDHDSDTDHRPI